MRIAGVITAVVVASIFGAAFYFDWFGRADDASALPIATSTLPVIGAEIPYYENISAWPRYEDEVAHFSIAFPIDFVTDPTHDGETLFTLAIPATFLPQTNFSEAILTVGERKEKQAVARCALGSGSEVRERMTSISGALFTVFTKKEAVAGDQYLTTSYRAISKNVCYVIEYVIHSTALESYPPEYELKPFDEAKIKDVLDRIVGTFDLL